MGWDSGGKKGGPNNSMRLAEVLNDEKTSLERIYHGIRSFLNSSRRETKEVVNNLNMEVLAKKIDESDDIKVISHLFYVISKPHIRKVKKLVNSITINRLIVKVHSEHGDQRIRRVVNSFVRIFHSTKELGKELFPHVIRKVYGEDDWHRRSWGFYHLLGSLREKEGRERLREELENLAKENNLAMLTELLKSLTSPEVEEMNKIAENLLKKLSEDGIIHNKIKDAEVKEIGNFLWYLIETERGLLGEVEIIPKEKIDNSLRTSELVRKIKSSSNEKEKRLCISAVKHINEKKAEKIKNMMESEGRKEKRKKEGEIWKLPIDVSLSLLILLDSLLNRADLVLNKLVVFFKEKFSPLFDLRLRYKTVKQVGGLGGASIISLSTLLFALWGMIKTEEQGSISSVIIVVPLVLVGLIAGLLMAFTEYKHNIEKPEKVEISEYKKWVIKGDSDGRSLARFLSAIVMIGFSMAYFVLLAPRMIIFSFSRAMGRGKETLGLLGGILKLPFLWLLLLYYVTFILLFCFISLNKAIIRATIGYIRISYKHGVRSRIKKYMLVIFVSIVFFGVSIVGEEFLHFHLLTLGLSFVLPLWVLSIMKRWEKVDTREIPATKAEAFSIKGVFAFFSVSLLIQLIKVFFMREVAPQLLTSLCTVLLLLIIILFVLVLSYSGKI